MQLIFSLMAFLWLQPAWGAAPRPETVFMPDTTEECIYEPVFDGKVCTLQTNTAAKTGVILIHGLGGSMNDWTSTIPVLAANFHVLAFDLPGFGRSDKGSKEYSPSRYAYLAQFLAEHYFRNKDYHIVGHSMGGAIALRFAAQRPLHFKRLVLIDVAGVLHPLVISKFQAGSLLLRTSGVPQTRGFAERISGRILEQVDRLPITPIDIANSALGRDNVLMGGPERIAALSLAGEDFSSAITSVTEPTLVLWGDNDMTVPLRTGRVLAARLPHARLEIITGSGHVPMQDQTAKTNTLIEKHLLASKYEMGELYPSQPASPELKSDRVGTCSRDSGMEFKGDYRRIELDDCINITIRNARVEQLSIKDSIVSLFDTDIPGKDEAVYAYNSDIMITNGNISGVIAIKSEYCRFDLAGVHLKASKDAIKAKASKFVFSVSQAHSSHTDGNLHFFRTMNDDKL